MVVLRLRDKDMAAAKVGVKVIKRGHTIGFPKMSSELFR